MAYTINTNIASMQAQEYLRVSSEFQQKTINRVTSGLRIIASGDDASGLAIANGFRSDLAVLVQGVRNGNDALSTLQTIDGGINNISKLLDRARTLATQSASGTFAGNREILNNEFRSVLSEIDRQAQAIGLTGGGEFAKSLSVFVGGGKEVGSSNAIANGSVGVNLTTSTVDSKSLGLKGFEAAGADAVDLSDGQATSVQALVGDLTNVSSAGDGFTDFLFYGPGFGDSSRIKVSVNTTGVTNLDTLVKAINSGIESAGNGSTAASTAFQNSQIQASVRIDADGSRRLAFNSSTTAFQVRAGDRMANAFLGNINGTSGKALDSTVEGGSVVAAGPFNAASTKVVVRFQGGGLTSAVDLTLDTSSGKTTAAALTDLSAQVAGSALLQSAGISLTTATAGSALQFTNKYGERFEVMAAGDLGNVLGLGSYRLSTVGTGNLDYTSIDGTGGAFADADVATFEFSVAGGAPISSGAITVAAGGGVADVVDKLNTFFLGDASLRAAQLTASNNGGQLRITSQNGTYFRLNHFSAADNFGFNALGGATVAAVQGNNPETSTVYSGGASIVEATANTALNFAAIRNATDDQTITLTVANANGEEKSKTVVLKSDGTSGSDRSGLTIDEALHEINRVLQTSNDDDFKQIIAVKERIDNTGEGIRFLSAKSSFRATLGTNASTTGLKDAAAQGTVLNSETSDGGSFIGIGSQANAERAVSALASAVTILGKSQAVVGKGQNQLNYAIGLAQTQITNISAAESRIRDADLATEAANLTKAQILQQAGIAALAQANSAPQAVLTLLRG